MSQDCRKRLVDFAVEANSMGSNVIRGNRGLCKWMPDMSNEIRKKISKIGNK